MIEMSEKTDSFYVLNFPGGNVAVVINREDDGTAKIQGRIRVFMDDKVWPEPTQDIMEGFTVQMPTVEEARVQVMYKLSMLKTPKCNIQEVHMDSGGIDSFIRRIGELPGMTTINLPQGQA